MTAQFQSQVNIYNALGIVGDIALADGGMRALAANLNSSGVPQLFGNYFTLTTGSTAQPAGDAPNGAIAQVGGTGTLGGILSNSKQNALYGTAVAGGALNASLALPDNSVGQLLQRGFVFVNLPGPANVGDLVTYDTATGNLNTIAPLVKFTASIAPGGSAGVLDVMTVTAVTAAALYVGMPVVGAGVAGGTFIASLGTGKGDTGTYNLTSVNEQTVGSEAMTGASAPAAAFGGLGYITTSAGVDTLHVTTATSGDVTLGMQVAGVGILTNTVVTAYGSGVGGTGTYTLNSSGQTVFSSGTPGAITGPTELFVPRATVYLYQSDTLGGNAIIKLDN